MQKKAGKIYFIDKELTDAEVDEQYVYPVWFVVSETIIDEAGEPYEISKHIIYNRNGIKSIFTGSGGGGYVLPIASSTVLGGVKVGNNLTIDIDGKLNSISAPQVNSDWNSTSGVSQILNKPTLSTVATSGNYNDLTGKPTIPSAQVNSDWNATSGVAQILNKPDLSTQVYKTITGNVTIDDSYHGAICRITANAIITFPSTLRSDFVTFFESVGTAKGTMTEGSSVTFDAPFGKVLSNNLTGYVLKSSASSYRVNGSFAIS